MLGPAARPGLETAGDKDRCLGGTAGPAEHLRRGSVRGSWCAGGGWDYGPSAEKEDGAGASWPRASTSGQGHSAPDTPHPGQLVAARGPSEAPGGTVGLEGGTGG